MSVYVLEHALATGLLNTLRSEASSAAAFREAGDRVAEILVMEATRDLPMAPLEVTTPLETISSSAPSAQVAVVGILRAGIGMVNPVLRYLPEAAVGFVGMERDETTAEARTYYQKLPSLRGRVVYVVDPMLATGGSAAAVLDTVFAEEPAEVRFLCIVAAPEGISRLEGRYPELRLFCGALDRELNDRSYILPGLGDYGDRLFGTC